MFKRRSVLPLAIFLMNTLLSYSQEYVCPIKSDFSWDKVEKKVSKSQVDQFIQSDPEAFQYYRQKDYKYANLDSLASRLHFLDINGDNRLDVIFEGANGGEATQIIFFINLGNTYKVVFSDIQRVFKMEWKENKLHKLYIYDGGCCADFMEFKRIYQAKYDGSNIPDFIEMSQATSIREAEKPDTVWENPICFEVLNDAYNIRSFPKVDDLSSQPWTEGRPESPDHGNIIGKLSKGATGTALAKKTDSSGREWWYVEMDEEFYPLGYAYSREMDYPTKVIGWISSRFVKAL